MIRKNAMSTMGYAIILVIILGVVMILSAPMMMSKYKGDKKSSDEYSKKDEDYDNYKDRERDKEEYSDSGYNRDMSNNNSSDDISRDLKILEDRMNSRFNDIEARQSQKSSSPTITDKYVCSIEGSVDSDGNVTPVDNMNMDEIKRRKIVFVCEYRN